MIEMVERDPSCKQQPRREILVAQGLDTHKKAKSFRRMIRRIKLEIGQPMRFAGVDLFLGVFGILF